jgi:hypothetical protein
MQNEDFHGFARELCAVRRPKPPVMKELTDEQILSWAHHFGIDYVDVNKPSDLDHEKAPVRSDELRIFARTIMAYCCQDMNQ